VPLLDGKRALEQRRTQPFKEQGAAILVGPQQPGAAVPGRQPQNRDLVPGVITSARNVYLQDRWRSVVQRGLGDERLRRVLVRPANGDRPFPLDFGDRAGKITQPPLGADREGLVPHGRANRPGRGLIRVHAYRMDPGHGASHLVNRREKKSWSGPSTRIAWRASAAGAQSARRLSISPVSRWPSGR
jgi:hypothetical protein